MSFIYSIFGLFIHSFIQSVIQASTSLLRLFPLFFFFFFFVFMKAQFRDVESLVFFVEHRL